jgi:hypothetical protein
MRYISSPQRSHSVLSFALGTADSADRSGVIGRREGESCPAEAGGAGRGADAEASDSAIAQNYRTVRPEQLAPRLSP